MSETEPPNGETWYYSIFEGAPVAMQDEDFSAIKLYLDAVMAAGSLNMGDYLCALPDAARECILRVHVRHVNRVARELYGAETEEQVLQALPSLFDHAALDIFREEVTALAEEAGSFEAELSTTTLGGERRRVVMTSRFWEPQLWTGQE